MPEGFPARIYSEAVLAPNFQHARTHFLDALIQIHYAHTRMLAHCGILSHQECATLVAALGGLNREQIRTTRFDGSFEDLFYLLENLLVERAGPDTAGKMHTARSRNDIAITLYRMTARRELLTMLESVTGSRRVLLDLAAQHVDTVMPAHTHSQPAQPTTLAHYLLAACEFLARDAERFRAAYGRVNLCPMGAAAITTSGFPIDREETARLLGFDGPVENSYGAIASIDYITESAAAVAVAMVNLGKLTQDLLLWSTREFGFLRLSDGFVQSSSIMPQKRNPVALEHVRILSSRALGQAQAVLTCAHNTPFGDINDSEDGVQPLVAAMFGDARRALNLFAGLMGSAEFDRECMACRAAGDFLTVTELADTLVRRAGMSFREAHDVVAEAVRACGSDDSPAALARALGRIRPDLPLTLEEIELALDPRHFVAVRQAIGGPAPERIAESLERARAGLRETETWASEKAASLDTARTALLRISD
jgi:argininosuccinate lyase